ncbi:hypothetical protein N9N67_04105 [Bacteriovoracaceae bacterium]|nr:hypothetical protein [Bacteriovoracaceae bacterium]
MGLEKVSLLFLAVCLNSSLLYSQTYHCKAIGDDFSVKHFTLSKNGNVFRVNEQDRASIDSSYKPTSPGKVRLTGNFTSIGEGAGGYSIDLILNEYLAKGVEFGYLELRAKGEGFFTYNYLCQSTLTVKIKFNKKKLEGPTRNYLFEMPTMCYEGPKEELIAKLFQLKEGGESLLHRDQGIQAIKLGNYEINYYGDQFFGYTPVNPDYAESFEELRYYYKKEISQWEKYDQDSNDLFIFSDLGPQGDGTELYATIIKPCS